MPPREPERPPQQNKPGYVGDPGIREEDAHNPGVTYEPREADLRVVLAFLAALGLAAAMVLVVLWGMFTYFRQHTTESTLTPEANSTPPKVPTPQLQPDPVADFNVYRLTDEEILNSYGWVDQKAGIARIPIDRAMDLLVQHGLPWKAPATGPASTTANPNPAAGPLPGAARGQEDLSKAKK